MALVDELLDRVQQLGMSDYSEANVQRYFGAKSALEKELMMIDSMEVGQSVRADFVSARERLPRVCNRYFLHPPERELLNTLANDLRAGLSTLQQAVEHHSFLTP